MRAVRTIMPGSLLPHAWDGVLRSGRSLGPGRRKAQAVACKHSAWPGGHTCSCNAGPCPGGGSPRVLWPALAPALEHDSCTAANARPCTYEQTCTDLLRHPVRSPLCHERERSAPHESLKVRGRHPPHSCPAAARARSRHTRGTSEKERRLACTAQASSRLPGLCPRLSVPAGPCAQAPAPRDARPPHEYDGRTYACESGTWVRPPGPCHGGTPQPGRATGAL